MPVWSDEFTFITGVVRYHDLAYISSVFDKMNEDRVPHTFVTAWDAGDWCGAGEGDEDMQKWPAVSAAVVKTPLEQALFLGEEGQVFCLGSGDAHEERIQLDPFVGPLRCVASVDGVAYACGMRRQVFRRNGQDDWQRMDNGALQKLGDPLIAGFEAIGGFSDQEIYATGWEGEIWSWNGSTWKQEQSPTGLILTAICCAEDGYVYMCGQSGVIIRGRHDKWELVSAGAEDLWSLAWHNGTLYAASFTAVYTLQDGNLTPIDFGDDTPSTCRVLSAADGVLWSIGGKDIFAFDGKKWTRID